MAQKQKHPVPTADKILGLATICVGCGPGGSTSMVAYVGVVDYWGQEVYCHFVRPTLAVTDYRTGTTGIEAAHLSQESAVPFDEVQRKVAQLIRNKIIVGHCLWQDLSVLGIPHPAVGTRDVDLYQPFRNSLRQTNHVGLPTLMWHLMRRKIQEGKVNAVENARAAMDLYRSHNRDWEHMVSCGQWPCHLPPSTFSRCYS